jgi:apolipoprotein D and lipocalin family protein
MNYVMTFIFLFSFNASALETVPSVDVLQYIGRWYQIARNPLIFEGDCYCSQQTLSLNTNGTVGVFNSCNKGAVDGPLDTISGFAVSVDPQSNAKFEVDFGLPFKGDYWIIGLDANYRYAVVSDPAQRSLYILSKTPVLDQVLYNEAVQTAAQQVDTSKLKITVQDGCSYPNL